MAITTKQLQSRRRYLGSSDTPVILGVSPYKSTPTDVYWSKIAETPEKEADFLSMGNYQEDALLRYASDRLQYDIVRNQFRVAHDGPGKGLFGSNHDAIVRDRPEGLEAKYANAEMAQDWGEEGTDQVPAHVTVQCQHQMYTSDLERVWVPVAMAGYALQYKLYCVSRDEELIAMLIAECLGWWDHHVERHIPPDGNTTPPEYMLKAIYREPTSVVELGLEAVPIVAAYELARDEGKEADEHKKDCYRQVIHLLGEAEGARLPDGRLITFKEQNSAPSVDTTRLKAEHPDLASEYIRQGRHRALRILKARQKGQEAMTCTCTWTEYEQEQKAKRQANRAEAARDFEQARALAQSYGMVLSQHSDIHYQLRVFVAEAELRWLYNVYPGNRRIWSDRRYHGPFLPALPRPWTLIDIVEAAHRAQQKGATPCTKNKTAVRSPS